LSRFNAQDICLLCTLPRSLHFADDCPDPKPGRIHPAIAELERLVCAGMAPEIATELAMRVRSWSHWWTFQAQQEARIDADFGSYEHIAKTSLLREVGEKVAGECSVVERRPDAEPPRWQRRPDTIMTVRLMALRRSS
jgi:hypothetical protein